MKLWVLKPKDGLPITDDPWQPWYDKYFGFVIRAKTEIRAREIANCSGADEVGDNISAWLSPDYSTCEELTVDGEEELILSDSHAA